LHAKWSLHMYVECGDTFFEAKEEHFLEAVIVCFFNTYSKPARVR
jgi:hypothetical protein